MRRTMLRFGGAALVTALVLALVPAAHAQRGVRSTTGFFGGNGYAPYGYSPYSGFGQGYGYGGYPGTYGNYNAPGYNPYNSGYTNYSTPGYYNNMAPGYTYSTPGYAGYQPGMVTGANPAYSNAMTGVPAAGQTQSMYPPAANTARITVKVPADATLWVDTMQSTQTGPVRVFVTPATLQPGQTYSYNLKAQWTENGQPVTREKKVDFQAGGQVTVDVTAAGNDQTNSNAAAGVPAAGQTQSLYTPSVNTARITVKVPADATLWVDTMQSTQTGPERVFVTPATLQPGQTYSYNLKAQWTENGQPVTREKKVDFQAGGQVTVDFMSGTEQ